jgi:hypothetical protein
MVAIPKKMYDAIQSQECIIFVGSGISVWSGLPPWKELIRKMIRFLEEQGLPISEKEQVEKILNDDLIKAASIASSKLRKANFRDFLDEIFVVPKPIPHQIHDIIVTLGPNCFVTTNYDHLIEDAYQKNHNGKTLFSVNNDQPIEHAKIQKYGADNFIFTPHGRIERSDTIIFTKNDYRKLKAELKSTIQTLTHLFISRPVIYLGYSLTDPDFIAIKDEIDIVYQGGERDHYAIIPDVCEVEKQFWKEHYGITIITYETIIDGEKISHIHLLSLLKEIQKTIHQNNQKPQNKGFSQELCGEFSEKISKNSLIRVCEDVQFSYSNLSQFNFDLHLKVISNYSKEENNEEYQFLRYVNSGGSISVNVFFNHSHNFVLIGNPGSGKTYSVKKISAEMAKRAILKLRDHSTVELSQINHEIPLILPMKEYSGDIKQMISSRLFKSIDADLALDNGIFTIIFDGINEVSRDLVERKILEPDLLHLFNKYPKNRFVFTSRSKEYLNFLSLPTVELTPLYYYDIRDILKNSINQLLEGQSENIVELLSNPFFLTIYLKANRDETQKIINVTSLLTKYFHQIEKELREIPIMKNISLLQYLPPIAFEIIERGLQGIPEEDIIHIIEKKNSPSSDKISLNAEKISQLLIINGILIPDSNGNLGFFHQTLLEFLAANELVKFYRKDPSILEQKINFLRWDETIILFIGLLSDSESTLVLNKIAEKDVLYACKSFSCSINQENKIGSVLFSLILKKLKDKHLTVIEKQNFAEGLKYVAHCGSILEIEILLDDEEISEIIAPILGNLNSKKSIPKLIKLLSTDRCWPSAYGKALSILIDEHYIHEFIQLFFNAKKNELLHDNIVDLLKNFKNNPVLTNEIIDHIGSSKINEKIKAIQLLSLLPIESRNSYFQSLLMDTNEKILHHLFFEIEFHFKNDYPSNRQIEDRLFSLLKNKKVGADAADVLLLLDIDKIPKKACILLQKTKKDIEKINLCRIIQKEDPQLSKTIIFNYLNDYNPAYKSSLENTIRKFNRDDVFPDILVYLSSGSQELTILILDCIKWILRHDEKINISDQLCDSLVVLLENQFEEQLKNPKSEFGFRCFDTGSFLTENCSLISKKILIEKINQPDYPYRKQLLTFIDRLPLSKSDFSEECILWLVKELASQIYQPYHFYAEYVPRVLGKILDENDITKYLLPNLTTENKILKNNVLVTIQEIERRIGKRIINN